MKTRVRYAPSPTGYLHVGGVRAFLFNWLYARKTGGSMILRIEDTDEERSKPEYEQMVIDVLRGLGLDYDEGPDVGGDFGPYRQSERKGIYLEHAEKLLNENKAYLCFCTPEELTEKREAAIKAGNDWVYDGKCAGHSLEDARKKQAEGQKASLRFRTPRGKTITTEDIVRGHVEFPSDTIGDFLITRSAAGDEGLGNGIGIPVYNFACVVDDHLMELTHVIRGEDHLSNTFRQLMLYEAFGWKPPQFAHTAMVLGADKQKLSKRSGDVSTTEYLDKGYLPEALVNFLAFLGWAPTDGVKTESGHPEVLTPKELVENFDINRLQKSPAVFDMDKLKWMNGFYIRHLDRNDAAMRARPFFDAYEQTIVQKGDEWFAQVIDIVREKVDILSELPKAADLFFMTKLELEEEARVILKDPENSSVVDAFEKKILAESELTDEVIGKIQKEVQKETGKKGKNLFMPFRALVTGRTHGPDLKKVLPLMGKEKMLTQIADIKKQAGL